MPRKKSLTSSNAALVTPARSSAKKLSKRNAQTTPSSSSLNTSSDRDEFGKLLKSVKKKYERRVDQEREGLRRGYQDAFEKAMQDLESQVNVLKNQLNVRFEAFMRDMQLLEEERQSTLKALQDDYTTLRTRVEGQVDKLNTRNDALQKRLSTYSKEMKTFYEDLEEDKGLVLSEYKQALIRMKKANKK